jgi:hypothetical protein
MTAIISNGQFGPFFGPKKSPTIIITKSVGRNKGHLKWVTSGLIFGTKALTSLCHFEWLLAMLKQYSVVIT